MIAALLLGCPKPPPSGQPIGGLVAALSPRLERRWVSPVQLDHPLVGMVWSVRAGHPATWLDLTADARGARYVYAGEKHDNPDHHLLQAELIAAVAPRAVVFEHLDHEDPIGDATTPDALREASKWDESGWPPFEEYRPVFDAVFAAGAKVVAGHPTRSEVKTAMNEGFAALPPEAIAGLPLDPGLPPEARASLAEEIVDTHCGMADEALVDKMLRAQLLKDTWMARAMTAQPEGPVVLVAGNGHTRGDRGVPIWVTPAPDRQVVVAFVEVQADTTDPTAVDPEGADWLVFTPRHDDDDPCARFRK